MNRLAPDSLAPLLRKLSSHHGLSAEEARALAALPVTLRDVPAGHDIIRQGDHPVHSCAMITGLTARFKIIRGGERQINSFHIPGDIPDLQSLFLERMDHGLTALTACSIALIPHRSLDRLLADFPSLARRLWRETLVDSAVFQEWMCNIGRRPAPMRIAHIICEMFVRYDNIGMAHDLRIPFPFTHASLGDAQGLSVVHVNRVLKQLRQAELIAIESRTLTVLDWPRLRTFADFIPDYLHIPQAKITATI